ncbi:MAG: biopolymer transporter ExbD [Thermodesulfobacteriota bacterium]
MKIRRRRDREARIEMLPLIDIVFLLLVFFIYAMLSMAVHRGLELDLPESSQAGVTAEREVLSLSIQVDGPGLKILVDGQALPLEELPSFLANYPAADDVPKVLVFAEERISYQQLYMVLDELKKSGVADISLQASSE